MKLFFLIEKSLLRNFSLSNFEIIMFDKMRRSHNGHISFNILDSRIKETRFDSMYSECKASVIEFDVFINDNNSIWGVMTAEFDNIRYLNNSEGKRRTTKGSKI